MPVIRYREDPELAELVRLVGELDQQERKLWGHGGDADARRRIAFLRGRKRLIWDQIRQRKALLRATGQWAD